jgi:hypothetical protein
MYDDRDRDSGVCLAPTGSYPQAYQGPYQRPYQQPGGDCRAVCALLYRICGGESQQQDCEIQCGGRAQTGDVNCLQNADDCEEAEACMNGIF